MDAPASCVDFCCPPCDIYLKPSFLRCSFKYSSHGERKLVRLLTGQGSKKYTHASKSGDVGTRIKRIEPSASLVVPNLQAAEEKAGRQTAAKGRQPLGISRLYTPEAGLGLVRGIRSQE